jgi:hypothetical protein
MNALQQYVSEILQEDVEKTKAFAKELWRNKDFKPKERHSLYGGDPISAVNFATKQGRIIKKLFAKYADREFLNSLLTIHWGSDVSNIDHLIKKGKHRDELSCGAYFPGEVTGHNYGPFGLLVKGHITLLANDMDNVISGGSDRYTNVNPSRTKSSGANKGVGVTLPISRYAYHPDEHDDYEPGMDPVMVLDQSDWSPRNTAANISNEAFVDNWQVVAIVLFDYRYKDSFTRHGMDIESLPPILTIEELNARGGKV